MERKNNKQWIDVLQKTALISGIFAFILCILIIVNYIQLSRVDPLNTKVMNSLTQSLLQNPNDETLREEIRELDLLARKAYFTNQWQIKTGGYLLLISIFIIIICIKSIELQQIKNPLIPIPNTIFFGEKINIHSKWVIFSGIFIVSVSLLLAFLTGSQMEQKFKALIKTEVDSTKNSQPLNKTIVLAEKDSIQSQETGDTTTISTTSTKGTIPSIDEIKKNFATFRGYGSNGVDFHKNIPVSWDGKSGKNILWKTEIPLHGYNSPIYWGEKIFLSGANATKREVYCMDTKTGKMLWKYNVEKIDGSPAVSPKVNEETGHSAPSLTTDGNAVFAIFSNGDIIALDLNGKKLWAKNLGLPQNHYGHSSSLIMYQNLIIVQYDQRVNPCVMALDSKTGKEVWKTNRDVKISWASPVIVNTGKRFELLLLSEPFLISYEPSTGKELWRVDCTYGEVGPSVAYSNGIVFAVNEYAKLAAVKIGEKPEIIWEDSEFLSDVPSPVALGDLLFLSTSYGAVVCYDAKTGKKHWTHELGVSVYSSPILVDGKIYLIDKKGKTYIFKADKTLNLLGEAQLGEGSFCTPAFDNGRIYIRGDKHLYCIGK